MKSDLDFLNDTLSAPSQPITTSPSPSSLDPNEPKDLASILATLQSLALQIPSEGEEGEEDYSNADDEMIASLLAKMDQAEGAADGLEARLDKLLGRLDGLLGDLGEDQDGDLRAVNDEKKVEEEGSEKKKVLNGDSSEKKVESTKDEEKV